MDPTNYFKYEDYRDGCILMSKVIAVIILIVGILMVYGAFSIKNYVMLFIGVLTAGAGVFAYRGAENSCKNKYDDAWGRMRAFGYSPDKPESYAIAKGTYDLEQMRNRMMGWRNNRVNTNGININF